jgi:adenosylcobinamide-GDP ribazoletransferase
LKKHLQGYFSSLAFLSRLPIPLSWQGTQPEDFARVPRYFWLAGLTLSGIVALVGFFALVLLPDSVAMAVLVGFQILLTGAFHEDGLADLADSIGANTQERRFEIMADSRLGTFGVSALGVLFLIRWTTYLALLSENPLWRWMLLVALIGGWGRWATVAVLKMLPYVHPTGKGVGQSLKVPGWTEIAIVAGILAILTALGSLGWIVPIAAAIGLTIGLSRIFFPRWLGGVNGDCLGAVCVFTEMLMLIFVCV